MLNAEERAYRFIINLILSGHYRPGDFLLEQEFTEKLNMSRTPVSRALARLVSEGFLNKMTKKGCYIPSPTPEDARQVFSARRCAESEAAALAARNATAGDVARLREILAEDHEAFRVKDKEKWAAINEAFHFEIAELSQNAYVARWVRNIFWRSNVYVFYFDSFYKPSDIEIVHRTPEQHQGIVRAIEAHDEEGAWKLMREHLDSTYTKLLFHY